MLKSNKKDEENIALKRVCRIFQIIVMEHDIVSQLTEMYSIYKYSKDDLSTSLFIWNVHGSEF